MIRTHAARAAIALAFALASSLAPGSAGARPLSVPSTPSSTPICGLTTTPPTYKHVLVIYEENTSYSAIVKSTAAPYINSLITACGLATNYHSTTHHSLPNYLATTAGQSVTQLQPFATDCLPSSTCDWTGTNLFRELGTRWMGYAESMPSNCDKADAGPYAPKHNPAVYYTDLTNCATNDVSLGTTTSSPLLRALASDSTAPAFATVTPNLCDDMHGINATCSTNLIQAGDNWLKQWVPLITSSAAYKAGDTALFIVWDEGSGGTTGENCAANNADQSCHVPAIVIAPSVSKGLQSSHWFTHYSLLKTFEDLLQVPEIGASKVAINMISYFGL